MSVPVLLLQEGTLVDLSLERAACALLLGEPDAAMQLLGLSGPGNDDELVDGSIKTFVLVGDTHRNQSPISAAWLPAFIASALKKP